MKTFVFNDMTLKCIVPDNVKSVESGSIDGFVKIDSATHNAEFKKGEPTQRVRYEHKKYSEGKATWSYNTTLRSARLYYDLNPDEDWDSMLEEKIVQQIKTAFSKMREATK